MILTNEQFVANVTQWAHDRNLIKGSSPDRQFLKLVSEAGEYDEAKDSYDRIGMQDGLGDTDVVAVIMLRQYRVNPLMINTITKKRSILTILGDIGDMIAKSKHEMAIAHLLHLRFRLQQECDIQGLNIQRCWYLAWDEIKNRKGWCENGVFIKEEPVS